MLRPSKGRLPTTGPVVFVIGSARIGGAESQMTRLACELKRRGVDVRMLFLVHGGTLTAQLDDAGVPWQVMRRSDWPPSSTLRNLYGLGRLAWSIARLRPRVVCAWLAGAVWPALISASLFSRATRIAGFRGEVFDRDLRWQAPLFRYAVERAHLVTVNSPSLRAEAHRWGAPPEIVRFLANGVDEPPVVAEVTASPAVAVVVANFRWYKGHDVLLEAMRTVKSDCVVRLCGEGAGKEELARRVQEWGLSDRIVFVDEPADIGRELGRAQFAIHPSRTEGLSNAVLEELSAGLPVIATDVGGTALLVEDGVNGLLVPAGSSAALASAIDTIARDPDLRSRMSVGARAKAASFSWKACTDQYLALLANGRSGLRVVEKW